MFRGSKLRCNFGSMINDVLSMLLLNQFRYKPEQESKLLLREGLMLCTIRTSNTPAKVWFTETSNSIWDFLHPINNDTIDAHQVLDVDCLPHITACVCNKDAHEGCKMTDEQTMVAWHKKHDADILLTWAAHKWEVQGWILVLWQLQRGSWEHLSLPTRSHANHNLSIAEWHR